MRPVSLVEHVLHAGAERQPLLREGVLAVEVEQRVARALLLAVGARHLLLRGVEDALHRRRPALALVAQVHHGVERRDAEEIVVDVRALAAHVADDAVHGPALGQVHAEGRVHPVEPRVDVAELQRRRVPVGGRHGNHHRIVGGRALDVVRHVVIEGARREVITRRGPLHAELELVGDLRIQVHVADVKVAVGQARGRLHRRPEVTLLVARRAGLAPEAEFHSQFLGHVVAQLGDEVDVVVGLIAVGRVEAIAQDLQPAGRGGHGGVHRAAVHRHAVVAHAELRRPALREQHVPLGEEPVAVALGVVEAVHVEHRRERVVDGGGVLRQVTVDTRRHRSPEQRSGSGECIAVAIGLGVGEARAARHHLPHLVVAHAVIDAGAVEPRLPVDAGGAA